MNIGHIINNTNDYLKDRAYLYENNIVESLYLSLRAKPFVILTGAPGCGKYTLAKMFCESIGVNDKNGRFKYINTDINMDDSASIFGHKKTDGIFVPSELMIFWRKALSDKDKPYFIYLDDMNMSRPEEYLLRVLTAMDTRYFDSNGNLCSNPLFPEDYFENEADRKEFSQITYPENLYIIASISADENSCDISLKIKDRANIIELAINNLCVFSNRSDAKTSPIDVGNEFLKPSYLTSADCPETEYMSTMSSLLQEINSSLRFIGKEIGFRTRNEILFYLVLNKNHMLMDENEAIDRAIHQRILTRIDGGGSYIKNILINLFKICVPGGSGDYSSSSFKMFRSLASTDCRYKKSAEKITYMTRRFEEIGYCSYRDC